MKELALKWFPAVFMAITIGMILGGPIMAYITGNGNWLFLCAAIIFYLS